MPRLQNDVRSETTGRTGPHGTPSLAPTEAAGAMACRAPAAAGSARRAENRGMLLGFVGVAMFSLTLPFTRMAVADLDPVFVALGRALVAAVLGALWLLWQRAPLPKRDDIKPLAWVAGGCILGFPLLTSIALRHVPASHGAVLIGILPLATAAISALRGNDKPSPGFWLAACTGSAIVIGYALRQSGGHFALADLMLLAAVLCAAAGYAEGGKLSQTMGGEATICWALLLAVPVLLPLLYWYTFTHSTGTATAGGPAWIGFAYVSAISMFIGFFFWYRGLALGGIARVGQVQLLQPVLTLFGAAALLGEPLRLSNLLFAGAVIAVVAVGRRMRVARPAAPPAAEERDPHAEMYAPESFAGQVK